MNGCGPAATGCLTWPVVWSLVAAGRVCLSSGVEENRRLGESRPSSRLLREVQQLGSCSLDQSAPTRSPSPEGTSPKTCLASRRQRTNGAPDRIDVGVGKVARSPELRPEARVCAANDDGVSCTMRCPTAPDRRIKRLKTSLGGQSVSNERRRAKDPFSVCALSSWVLGAVISGQ